MEGAIIILVVTFLIGAGSIFFFGKDNSIEKEAEKVIEYEVHEIIDENRD
jgi:hypothetical protein